MQWVVFDFYLGLPHILISIPSDKGAGGMGVGMLATNTDVLLISLCSAGEHSQILHRQ